MKSLIVWSNDHITMNIAMLLLIIKMEKMLHKLLKSKFLFDKFRLNGISLG